MSLLLTSILAFTNIFPAFFGTINYGRIGHPVKLFTWIFLASVSADALAVGLAHSGHHNIWVSSIYIVVESWVLCRIFYSWLGMKWIFPIIPIGVTLLAVVELFTYQGSSASVVFTSEAVVVILLSILLIYNVYKGFGMNVFSYVIIVAFLFYYTSNLTYFILSNSISGEALEFVVDMHSIVNAICNITFGICLWKLGTKPLLSAV